MQDYKGLTEIAGLDIEGQVKTGLDIAGLDNDGRVRRGGHCRTGH